MRYGSVCSGIEAATAGWHHLGWEPAFFSEIEQFPRSVLAHHYPEVPLHGDFTTIGENDYGSIDLLVGGTPCQSFSVAGLRKGMDDERGNLSLEYLKLAQRKRPTWLVWENVPGVLSSNGGRDFGAFLGGLVELGYGFAYRVLDAQYFGVAQRRRRVFVVGYLGDWRRAAAVLFERESLSWNPAPSREKGEDVAKCLTTGVGSRLDSETDTFVTAFHPTQTPISSVEGSHALGANSNATAAVAFAENQRGELREQDVFNALSRGGSKPGQGYPAVAIQTANTGANGKNYSEEVSSTLDRAGAPAVQSGLMVRRLTPLECERLQGFPDNYTQVPHRNKPAEQCPDGPRYKALGNSMAVPVMRWIAERIVEVERV